MIQQTVISSQTFDNYFPATYRIDPIPTIPEPKFGNLMMRNVPDDGFERKYYGFIDGPNKAMVQNRRGTSCRGLSFGS